jgi:hypothetical protein
MSDDWRKRLDDEAETLRRMRDELRVQAHLGAAEARERWDKLEERWGHLEGKLRLLGQESKESLEEVGEAARLLAREIRDGYQRLKKLV